MLILYRLFFRLLSPLLIFISWKHYRQHHDKNYLYQRLGFKYPKLDQPLWIHCASVGEINAAQAFIEQLIKTGRSVLVTTNTITAAKLVQQKLPSVTHCYLPLDFTYCIDRFIKATSPAQAIIVETELWPNLFHQLAKKRIDITIINARLSRRTLETNRWMLKLYKQTLTYVKMILCRSDTDYDAYQKLGAEIRQLKTIGNLKFAQAGVTTAKPDNLINRPYVLLASSREAEERIVFNAWKQLEISKPLLVIAPRHPERRDEILESLQLAEDTVRVRSRNQPIDDSTAIYLADTIGELPALFAHASFVIMGGSFVNKGGHNILEPAKLGKAIIYGPHMENFEAENSLFLHNDASIQVNDPDQLKATIITLLTGHQQCAELGRNAKNLVETYSDIAERYIEELEL